MAASRLADDWSGRLLVDQAREPPQRQLVALGAEAGDDAVGAERYVGVVAEGLALVDVGDVHLDDREFEGIQRVKDRQRGVGERARG